MNATKVEAMAKLKMFEAGDDWYRKIYVKPDVQVITRKMEAVLAKVRLSDLMPVLAPYLITNASEEAMQRTAEWARALFGVKMKPKILLTSETNSMESRFSRQEGMDEQWELVIGQEPLHNEPVELLVGSVAHEVWHAYQRECAMKWEERPGIVLTNLSMEDRHELMYALNQMHIVMPKQNSEIYMSQLIEAEAYMIMDKVRDMLQRVLVEAYRRGEIPKQLLMAATSLSGRPTLIGAFC